MARASTRRSMSRPLRDEIFGRIAMADALDVLVDDRALVEVARDIMRGGADQLDAALVRLVVGPRALEARQERVVDVDAAPGQLCRHLVRQDLHVARQHHEIGLAVLAPASRPPLPARAWSPWSTGRWWNGISPKSRLP